MILSLEQFFLYVISKYKLYNAIKDGNKFDIKPTESFFPKIKYVNKIVLPVKLNNQNQRVITGRPAFLDVYNCKNQRLAKVKTPKYPKSFHPVIAIP